jgi:hypothetical protein
VFNCGHLLDYEFHRNACLRGFRVCVRTGETAGPSTTLRSGRDDKGRGCSFSMPERHRSDFLAIELSSRPERSRISCHAAPEKAACAPFCKGKAHEVRQRHQPPQEIRGSVVEGPAVSPVLTQTLKPSLAADLCGTAEAVPFVRGPATRPMMDALASGPRFHGLNESLRAKARLDLDA